MTSAYAPSIARQPADPSPLHPGEISAEAYSFWYGEKQALFDISLRIASALRSADVQTILVKDGDHRLSRPQDIARILAAVAEFF